MWLILLEAGIALFLLVFIVWWTMFSGKKQDQPAQQEPLSHKDNPEH
ncbi:MAG TPA: hypothetical protein VJ698_15055 [Noviherbaspirillum sp.]|nr:hypothetical protein [Noviherbaspirillum sp.]HJV86784.1 hypothetical protein [Noviherbaspirillum sp.]